MDTRENIRKKLQRHVKNVAGTIDRSCPLSYWYKTTPDGPYAFIYLYRGQEIKCFLSKEEGEIWSTHIEECERKA